MSKRQRLDFDLNSLFPQSSCTIAGCDVVIVPLNLEQIASLSHLAEVLIKGFVESGVTLTNITEDMSKLTKVVGVILSKAPELLEEASNIHIDDLKKLPISEVVKLVSKIIEVNGQSKDDLLKNFRSLIAMLPLSPQE